MEALGIFIGQSIAAILMIYAIAMLIVGPIQLVWAIIHPIANKDKALRRQYGYYWVGVIVYLVAMIPFFYIDNMVSSFGPVPAYLQLVLFFQGGIALAIYHIKIVYTGGKMDGDFLYRADFESRAIAL